MQNDPVLKITKNVGIFNHGKQEKMGICRILFLAAAQRNKAF